jgi:zinc/manganese transport system substrate-binding protein
VHSPRSRRSLVLAVLASGLLAGACGRDAPPAGSPDVTSTSAAPVGATSAATADEPADPERPVVAVTTNILADVTAAVAGDLVEVVDLMPRGADPHSFALSLADAEQLLAADLVIANGLGLEAGLLGVIQRAVDGQTPVLEIGPLVDPLPYGNDIDEGSGLDPHVWTDPRRMVAAVEIIADELAGLIDDSSADTLAASADDYLERLADLDGRIEAAVAALPEERRRLVTNHHVLGYFADRYGFEVLGAVVPSGTTLASPSARDLADLTTVIEAAGVSAIFAETSQPGRLVEALASEAGIDVAVVELYSESLGPSDGPAGTYLDMMRFNADAIVGSLAPSG